PNTLYSSPNSSVFSFPACQSNQIRNSKPYYLPAIERIPITTHTTILIPVIRTVNIPSISATSIPPVQNNAESNSDN
ncbi:9023_t:CDS:1, partial [Funneliformis mosseae]